MSSTSDERGRQILSIQYVQTGKSRSQTYRIIDQSDGMNIWYSQHLSALKVYCIWRQNADPSFVTIENWIHGRLRNHKYLSVNSHEIQRRLENLVERLTFANYEPHSERLTQLCERLRSSALCANHSEADFYWMLMSFLLDVARNPVDALDRNLDHRNALLQDEKVVRPTSYKNTTVDKRTRDLVADLLVDNFIAADGVSDNESVLSVCERM